MKMQLTIYINGKQCNEINITDPANIYKHIAQIYHAKDIKRASQTKIEISCNGEIKAVQTFKNQSKGIIYTYKYKFIDVSL